MVTLTNYTREEFLDIFRRAKSRKAQWQEKVEQELNEMSDSLVKSKVNESAAIN